MNMETILIIVVAALVSSFITACIVAKRKNKEIRMWRSSNTDNMIKVNKLENEIGYCRGRLMNKTVKNTTKKKC